MNKFFKPCAFAGALLLAATLDCAAQYSYSDGSYKITSAPAKLVIEVVDGPEFDYPRADNTEMRVKLFDAKLMESKKWSCVDDIDERDACYFHAGASAQQTTPCESDDWETFIKTMGKCQKKGGGCWVKVFVKNPTKAGLKDEKGRPITIIKVSPEECGKLVAQYK